MLQYSIFIYIPSDLVPRVLEHLRPNFFHLPPNKVHLVLEYSSNKYLNLLHVQTKHLLL